MNFPDKFDDDEDMQLFLKELQLAGYDWDFYLVAEHLRSKKTSLFHPKGGEYWIMERMSDKTEGLRAILDGYTLTSKGDKILPRYIWEEEKWKKR